MRDLLNDLSEGLSHPDPIRRAQIQMKKPLPKRFYKEASVGEREGGFAIELDGKPVKTPARQPLVVPTEALATLIAGEWQRQAEVIDPAKMPATRLDQYRARRHCRRSAGGLRGYPAFLLQRYALLSRRRTRAAGGAPVRKLGSGDRLGGTGARRALHTRRGRHAPGTAARGDRCLCGHRAQVRHADRACLPAHHHVADRLGHPRARFRRRTLPLTDIWSLAHLDEDWTIEHWGSDAEAEQRRADRFVEYQAATDVFSALRS